MTDKQIKDGIDVSQCECYSVEDNSCNDTLSGSCMKEKCQTFRLLQTIKAKEQECEELKELVKKQKDVLIHKTILADEYEKAYSFENLKVAKLKYCLTEIKEIMKKHCRKCKKHKFYHFQLCCTCKYTDILQKISEVEDVRN